METKKTLKEVLDLEDMSIQQFADKIGKTYEVVKNWCYGRSIPKAQNRALIFKALPDTYKKEIFLWSTRKQRDIGND